MTLFTSHFKTAPVIDSVNGEEIEVGQLVTPEQILVSANSGETESKGRIDFEAGENAQLVEGGTAVTASCYGYPRLRLKSAEKKQAVHVAVIPFLTLSEDLMEARLLIVPPVGSVEVITLNTVLDILHEAGVVYGVDEQAITDALAQAAEIGATVECICARGKLLSHGKDAELRFEIDVGPTPGRELADGSIDFRERNMFVPVAENQIIARKTLATAGIAGMDLTGKELPATNGKDLQVKVSEDVAYNEDDLTVRATAAGVLTIVGKDTIRVSSQQKIDGDIDYSTGNIRSHFAVHITGSIRPEFKVSTKGDIQIDGDVQSASVNSHGNIVVKGGILGPTSIIKVQGDADIHHIERSQLQAGGDVIVRGSSYYSTIFSGGNISGTDNAKVMGGELQASGSIVITKIGSASASPCTIAVGVDYRRYKRYRDMQKEYQQLLEETTSWYNRHGKRKKSGRIDMMEEEMVTIERELSQFNLIAGSPEGSLGDPDHFYTSASVVVKRSIAAGTTIRIGNEVMTTKYDLGKATFQLDKTSGAIAVTTA